MEKIKLSETPRPPTPVSRRVIRTLSRLMHMELSLSIARGVIVALDSLPGTLMVDINWMGINAVVAVYTSDEAATLALIREYPQYRPLGATHVIGLPSEPCVHLLIESASINDTHRGD